MVNTQENLYFLCMVNIMARYQITWFFNFFSFSFSFFPFLFLFLFFFCWKGGGSVKLGWPDILLLAKVWRNQITWLSFIKNTSDSNAWMLLSKNVLNILTCQKEEDQFPGGVTSMNQKNDFFTSAFLFTFSRMTSLKICL